MYPYYYYYDSNIGGGWYCAYCGEFVPLNTNHQCTTRYETTGNYQYKYQYPSDRDLLLKILEKFDEVLKALKDK